MHHPEDLHDRSYDTNIHESSETFFQAYTWWGKIEKIHVPITGWIFTGLLRLKKSTITGEEFRCLLYAGRVRLDIQKNFKGLVPELRNFNLK